MSAVIGCGKFQQAFAAPDAHHPDMFSIMPIDDSKRWIDQFAQKGLVKLRHDPTHGRVISQVLHARYNLLDELGAGFGRSLFRVPRMNGLKVAKRGLREADNHR